MTATEPLDPLHTQAWESLVSATARLSTMLETYWGRTGITHMQHRILRALAAQPDHQLKLVELARQVDASLSRLSHSLDKLEQAGLVARVPVQDSRTRFHAVLTDTGLRTVQDTTPAYLTAARAMALDALTEDQIHNLLEITETLRAHLGEPA